MKTHLYIAGLLALCLIFYVFYKLYLNQESTTRAMIIIEPRAHTLLKQVIENFDMHMDKSWDLYVFYGNLNKEVAQEAISNITGRKVILISLNVDNISSLQYNKLLKTSEFWSQINAEDILVFQTDAVLCSKSIQTINDYIMYDYIGCSYDNKVIGSNTFVNWGPNNEFYGIGGLSFRKKSFMLQCIRDSRRPEDHPEDMFFSECVAKSSRRPPSARILNQFCTQHVYKEKSLGAHKTNIDLQNKDEFYKYCPEAKMLEHS